MSHKKTTGTKRLRRSKLATAFDEYVQSGYLTDVSLDMADALAHVLVGLESLQSPLYKLVLDDVKNRYWYVVKYLNELENRIITTPDQWLECRRRDPKNG